MDRFDMQHLEYLMSPISRGGPSGNWPVGATQQVTPATANTRLSLHSYSLTPARLSQHSLDSLKVKESQGSANDQLFARLVKESMAMNLLLITSTEQTGINASISTIVEFGRAHDDGTLVVKAKLNSLTEYDILFVGFRSASGEVSMRLPPPRDEAGIAWAQPPPSTLQNRLEAEQTGRPNNGYAPITTPLLDEHQTLMGQLPTTLDRSYRNKVSRFLCHLEVQVPPQSWSALAPAGDRRPLVLEAVVNTLIEQKTLHVSTRAAINAAFDLQLLASSGRELRTPTSNEHQAVMGLLPTTLSSSYRSRVSRFLCHLEDQIPPQSWSALRALAPAGEQRPLVLEAVVNTAIELHGVNKSTRAAINTAFNLKLLATSGRELRTPARNEHQALMRLLPTPLTRQQRQQRSLISLFLCHLEDQIPPQSWSALAPAGERRPLALEEAVNTAIAQHKLNPHTRAAINHGFSLTLRVGRKK